MTTFLLEFRNIFIFIVCSFVLAIVLLAAVYILSFTSKVDLEKSSAYECGFQLFSETSYSFEILLAVTAIMFLLFNKEVLHLFPLVQFLYSLYSLDLIIILSLYFLLVIRLLYEISKKVLNFQTIAYKINKRLNVKMHYKTLIIVFTICNKILKNNERF